MTTHNRVVSTQGWCATTGVSERVSSCRCRCWLAAHCPAVRLACFTRARHVASRWWGSFLVVVELLEHLLDLVELVFGLLDDLVEALQRLVLLDVLCACLVLQLAVVLDLRARVLDLGQAEGSRGALEEVAELAERLELFLLAAYQSAVCSCRCGCRRLATHRFVSILTKVPSAWVKKS